MFCKRLLNQWSTKGLPGNAYISSTIWTSAKLSSRIICRSQIDRKNCTTLFCLSTRSRLGSFVVFQATEAGLIAAPLVIIFVSWHASSCQAVSSTFVVMFWLGWCGCNGDHVNESWKKMFSHPGISHDGSMGYVGIFTYTFSWFFITQTWTLWEWEKRTPFPGSGGIS